jgi:hypothetical protein
MQTVRKLRLLSPALALGALMLAGAGACGSSPAGSEGSKSGADGGSSSGSGGSSGGTGGGSSGVGGDDGGAIFVSPLSDGAVTTSNVPRCIAATQQCVSACTSGGETALSGTVYDPAGKNPLYGIVVYIPSEPVAPIATGASCYSCNSLYTGNPIAYAVTDSAGKFTIHGVPDGANIPLVVQVGKWRMQYTLPSVTACQTSDPGALLKTKLTLPANHQVGDIPSIAIATGGADSLECLLHRIGVDEAEYGPGPGSAGRIHIFYGDGGSNTSPAGPNAWSSLWDTQQDLMAYDITLLTCEGHEATSDGNSAALTPAMRQALYDYAQNGGRVFASHYHYNWFNAGPFGMQNLATWQTGSQHYDTDPNAVILQTLPTGQPFPRGVAMHEWLTNVNALTNDELHIVQARHNALVTAANTASLPWIETDTMADPPSQTEYFSFDTPFGTAPAEQCGRVVYSDLHVGAASGDYGGYTDNVPANSIVPTGCGNGDLSPQEKALEFMLFDLSGCITPPDQGAGGLPPPPK